MVTCIHTCFCGQPDLVTYWLLNTTFKSLQCISLVGQQLATANQALAWLH